MSANLPDEFSEPVAHLIQLGEEKTTEDWFDYGKVGISEEHIPELIRIIRNIDSFWEDVVTVDEDEFDDDLINREFAPIHAWRALGQMRTEQAIDPLIELIVKNEDLFSDWIMEETPEVLGMIGPASIPALRQYLLDPNKKVWAANTVSSALGEVAQRYPDSRSECLAALQAGLENYQQNGEVINGFLVSQLADMKAVEVTPLVEAAFQADAVDLTIMGDFEDYQIAVGLLNERLTPAPERPWQKSALNEEEKEKKERREEERRKKEQAKKEKQKRKQEKKARRRSKGKKRK